MFKICTTCLCEKPLEDFASQGAGKKRAKCKKCLADQKRDYYKRNPDKAHQRNLKTFYGITKQDYAEMFEKQNGACACCGKVSPLNVDHCHSSGTVRGLLCTNCNIALGHFKDDVDLIRKAIAYLKHHGAKNRTSSTG
jgi:hypothetical protein